MDVLCMLIMDNCMKASSVTAVLSKCLAARWRNYLYYLLDTRNTVHAQFLQWKLQLLIICCSCPVHHLLLPACWPLRGKTTFLNTLPPETCNDTYFAVMYLTHLATYADLRLQFGKLLLVHYRLLHLLQETDFSSLYQRRKNPWLLFYEQ